MTRGVRPSPWQAIDSETSNAATTSHCELWIAVCGLAGEGPIEGAGRRIRRPDGAIRNPKSATRILFLAQREEIREEAIGPRDPRRQLPEEAQPGVHVRARAHRGHEQSALER